MIHRHAEFFGQRLQFRLQGLPIDLPVEKVPPERDEVFDHEQAGRTNDFPATPPVGYCAKQESDKVLLPTPLPAEPDPDLQVIRLAYDPHPPPPAPSTPPRYPVVTPELISLVERERDPDSRIVVADSLRNPHPVIQRTRQALADRPNPDRYNLRQPSCHGDTVNLAVAEQSVPRALRLMNALFLALEKTRLARRLPLPEDDPGAPG